MISININGSQSEIIHLRQRNGLNGTYCNNKGKTRLFMTRVTCKQCKAKMQSLGVSFP